MLLSLDTARTDMNKPDIKRTDGDFALSWIRNYGQGRVFYCALGHQQDVYWRPAILKHYLAGIQFAMGDLEADAAPRAASTPAAVDKKVLNLVFCCRADNDLYRVMTADGKQYPRFDTAAQAIQGASEGAGVLILADRLSEGDDAGRCGDLRAGRGEEAAAVRRIPRHAAERRAGQAGLSEDRRVRRDRRTDGRGLGRLRPGTAEDADHDDPRLPLPAGRSDESASGAWPASRATTRPSTACRRRRIRSCSSIRAATSWWPPPSSASL